MAEFIALSFGAILFVLCVFVFAFMIGVSFCDFFEISLADVRDKLHIRPRKMRVLAQAAWLDARAFPDEWMSTSRGWQSERFKLKTTRDYGSTFSGFGYEINKRPVSRWEYKEIESFLSEREKTATFVTEITEDQTLLDSVMKRAQAKLKGAKNGIPKS